MRPVTAGTDFLALVAAMQARAARIEARFDAVEAQQRELAQQLAAARAELQRARCPN